MKMNTYRSGFNRGLLLIILVQLPLQVVLAQNRADSIFIQKLFSTALVQKQGYHFLKDLCKNAGPRISGSPEAAKAVDIAYDYLKRFGADTVYKQEVMVPHWVRGKVHEGYYLSGKTKHTIKIEALGGSIATPVNGITAEVIEVKGLKYLKNFSEKEIKGKMVFFNGPMEEEHIQTFKAYGGCVSQRWAGAMEAAKLGAVAVIIRSVTMAVDYYPHTGSMGYNDTITKIPAVATSTIDADKLSKELMKNPSLKLFYNIDCQTLPDVLSYNVIGEIKGSLYPNDVILVGGHLDAWDLAEGAHDDGAGIAHSLEVIRLFKELGYQPKRTIRVVCFMNEENGLRGAIKYGEWAKTNGETHILALETDAGGFTPRGFSFDTDDKSFAFINTWQPLLHQFGIGEITRGGSGADISRLKGNCTILCGLHPDSQRYFDHHHAANDVFEAVHPRELELGSAACAALLYLVDKHW
ncbi:MAG: M20/M25/M40 family metallo-hydrolase [Bacteroidota bacterium]